MKFEPFDECYLFDVSLLTEEFPGYLIPGIEEWVTDTLWKHDLLEDGIVLSSFLHSLNRTFRTTLSPYLVEFLRELKSSKVLLRNVLSYILQKVADSSEAHELERILNEGSSAYSVEFIRGNEVKGFRNRNGEPLFEYVRARLVYRVPLIVKKQALGAADVEELLSEAWEFYYGLNADDEKTVVRATDALSGLLRDKFFPNEKWPVFGSMLKKIQENPNIYSFPASSIYQAEDLLKLMKEFSKIRGNHQKGTGRMPTHEEAGFVLHLAIMLFQIFRNTN